MANEPTLFDNTTKAAAHEELKGYFHGKTANLYNVIAEAIKNNEPLTADRLAFVSDSHRYGAILHQIKSHTPVRWTITREDGVLLYHFYREGGKQ